MLRYTKLYIPNMLYLSTSSHQSTLPTSVACQLFFADTIFIYYATCPNISCVSAQNYYSSFTLYRQPDAGFLRGTHHFWMSPLSQEDKTILSLKETEGRQMRRDQEQEFAFCQHLWQELPLFCNAVQRADITMIDVSFQIRGILQNLGRQSNDSLK